MITAEELDRALAAGKVQLTRTNQRPVHCECCGRPCAPGQRCGCSWMATPGGFSGRNVGSGWGTMMAQAQLRFNLLSIALHALQMVRPFVKLNGQQSAAWDLVMQILGGGGQ